MNKLNQWTQTHPFLLAVVVILVVVMPGFFRTEQAISRATEASKLALESSHENNKIAVVNCQNANDMRQGNKILWLFVLRISESDKENQTAEQQLVRERFKSWIIELYEPHDCSNLDKKYTIPEPPVLPGLTPDNR